MHNCSAKNMHMYMLLATCRPVCLGLNVSCGVDEEGSITNGVFRFSYMANLI